MKDNIILIGMPGSGKSTLGVQLAKELGLDFIDTDLLIQNHHQKKLQDILEDEGCATLRAYEEAELLKLQPHNTLIATGGSAVYSGKAMDHLSQLGKIVYLQVSFKEIEKRIDNEDSRGIAREPGQSLLDVYNERVPLYERYAKITIDNDHIQPLSMVIEQIDH